MMGAYEFHYMQGWGTFLGHRLYTYTLCVLIFALLLLRVQDLTISYTLPCVFAFKSVK